MFVFFSVPKRPRSVERNGCLLQLAEHMMMMNVPVYSHDDNAGDDDDD